MTMIEKDFLVCESAFCLSSEKHASNAPISPADTLCFDIFSPPPGDIEVISQVERLSSNHASPVDSQAFPYPLPLVSVAESQEDGQSAALAWQVCSCFCLLQLIDGVQQIGPQHI